MKVIILVFFLITGCSYDQAEKKKIISNISFTNDLSWDEFKNKLEVYTKNSPYPEIDN